MSIAQKAASIANVKVVCRFRPINERQKSLGGNIAHELLDDKTVAIKVQDSKDTKQSLKFSFDKVFDTQSKQQEVYNYAASSVIDSVIQGFNGTIFAYGQTSSGKTHTMEGDVSKQITTGSGIIPRMVKHVFKAINSSTENIEFRIKVSLVELYMEKLRDLIDPNKSDLKIRSDKKRGVFIEDLTQNYISRPEEVYDLMELARNSRVTASTNMNEKSSRSHMIFIITISQNDTSDLSAKTGKLYLVDLAGSQKVGKTGAEGKVLDEAKKINTSLAALGKVINALTDGKSTHIPYRDSKLTRVLQQSLGGNSKTSLIVTCSPHQNNILQTISSLRFGISAKKIRNKPKINKEMTVAELQSQLQKVQKQLCQKEKYLHQLKEYIIVDLKQKSVPQFKDTTMDNNLQSIQTEQNDLMGQLQRQLEMERNLHLVQEEQISSLKIKCDQITNDKQNLQKQLQTLKQKLTSFQILIVKQKIHEQKQQTKSYKQEPRQYKQERRQQQTYQKGIVQTVKKTANNMSPEDLQNKELLQKYQQQRQRRIKSQDQMIKYQKIMQKKLIQLENNMCQLTHAYYDLVVVQQRYKVDNIFLKKKLQQKDTIINSLKSQLKESQAQNRTLEQDKWDVQVQDNHQKKKNSLQKNHNILQDHIKRRQNSNTTTHTSNTSNISSKVVKVLKGGQK